MNTRNSLEPTLKEILGLLEPLREDWEIRWNVINELRDVVGTVESLRGATVEPFGSFLSNLFTRWGDLDISVELSNGSYISSPGRKHKQTLLGYIFRELRKKGSFHRLQFVRRARVPILKFQNIYQNISCDISINNLSGHMKSKCLLWISDIDQRFRDLVLLVKEWAKANGINDPKTGTLNSYSLTLLLIFHLQTCVPAILPPLKEIYPGNMADELTGVRAHIESHIKAVCAANIVAFRRQRGTSRNSLSELFISFLAKFSDISMRAAEQGICTFTGQWEDISTNTRWLPKTFALYIEDPFDQRENTARAVNALQLTRISEVIRATHLKFISPSQNRASLLTTLVQPHIIRPPINHQNFNAGQYSRTVPTGYRGLHSPSQSQGSFQNRIGLNSLNNVAAVGTSSQNLPLPGRSVSNFRVQEHNNLIPANYDNRGRASVRKPVKLAQGREELVWKPKISDI